MLIAPWPCSISDSAARTIRARVVISSLDNL
jgi:hypothetical protein